MKFSLYSLLTFLPYWAKAFYTFLKIVNLSVVESEMVGKFYLSISDWILAVLLRRYLCLDGSDLT